MSRNWTQAQVNEANIRMRGKDSPAVNPVAAADEGELQDSIIAECRRRGWFVIYSGMHRRTSVPVGTPDFVIYADRGRVFTVETKSKTAKQTPEQLGVQMMLEKLGHKYHLIRSFEEFLELLK